MSITLDGLTLPYELVWIDEFSWTGVNASAAYTLQGVQVREESKISNNSGRPVTLESDQAWMTKTNVQALFVKAQTLNKKMTLTLNDGRSFRVSFRHDDKPEMIAEPVKKIAEQGCPATVEQLSQPRISIY